MKILLAIDSSACSDAAVTEVAERPWPAGSKVKIVTAIESPFVAMPQSAEHYSEFYEEAQNAMGNQARATLDRAAARIIKSDEEKTLKITAKILKGSPMEVILDEAESWDADLIIVGSHSYRAAERALLGSVSQTVATHAKCSVEIVRERKD